MTTIRTPRDIRRTDITLVTTGIMTTEDDERTIKLVEIEVISLFALAVVNLVILHLTAWRRGP